MSEHLHDHDFQAWEYWDASQGQDELIDLLDFERRKRITTVYASQILLRQQNRKKTTTIRRSRCGNKFRKQVDPDFLIEAGVKDGLLVQEYRMGKNSINKLFELIKDKISARPVRCRKDVILPKTKLLVTLRYLAGSRWVDCSRIHGISKSSVHKSVREVCKAISNHAELGKVKFP